jgi:hypothetical protein
MALWKRAFAEFIGTFWLVFGGCGSAVLAAAFPGLGIGFVGVSLAFGLTVLTMAFAIGHVSGCHLNPAVSVGLVVGKRFKLSELPAYVIAQVLGGIAACAESSVTSVPRSRPRHHRRACGASNTAATTRPASPSAAPASKPRSKSAAPPASSQPRRSPARAPLDGTFGIGHTRWATHGRPTEENAHPHRDCTGRIVVVHNGIVENYLDLKRELTAQGHKFVTETDTEIIAHLIEQVQKDAEASGCPIHLKSPSNRRVQPIPSKKPSAAPSSASPAPSPSASSPPLEPDKIVAARFGPPVVIGVGEGESFVASDVPGILHHTRNIYFLADGDMAILTLAGVALTDFDGNPIQRAITRITWDPIQAEKGGYKHFMLKEIWEQPRAIRDTTLGRVSLDSGKVFLGEMKISDEELAAASSINIAACGTSWHAALAGKYMIERLARLPVDVDYASEYRYRNPIPDPTPSACSSPSPARPPTPSPPSAR